MDLILFLTGLFGLIIGSFLNVVIVRYPKMLSAEWQHECKLLLELPTQNTNKPYNLAIPRSHCPHCQQPLQMWHLIPLLSFICLRARCAFCAKKISWHYPLVELLSALLAILAVVQFKLAWPAVFAILFSFSLIILSFIDIKEQILPDMIIYSVLWLGLFANCFHFFASLENAVLGVIFGYLSLWLFAMLFQFIRKKPGMGHGDFKMFAMIGAWVGVSMLFNVILIAAALGLLTSLVLLVFRKIKIQSTIPFGPFLAVGGWVNLVYGPFMINTIMRIF